MLRLLVLLLLLANAAYYGWTQGLLRPWGWAPEEPSEPERLAQQIRPEALQILPPGTVPAHAEAAAAPEAAPAALGASLCLHSAVLDPAQAERLRAVAAASLPSGSWSLEATPLPGHWIVYMGRFADTEALEKKRSELRAIKVPFERPHNPALEPGLSLGRFASEDAAQRARTALGSRGVRTARVVQERAAVPGFTLRLPAVNDALLPALDPVLAALENKELRPCP
ncbi:MAG: SPOR domain-containing protein [Burkholderiaceae bacterium]|nr:SPOR domain-containing protein [Burkholderiaceae bacterium]